MKSLVFLFFICLFGANCMAQEIHVLYAEQQFERPPVLSGLHPIPSDLGLQGAKRAIFENNTTGKMTGQTYVLDTVIAAPGESLAAKVKTELASHSLLVINAPAKELLEVADLPEAKGALLLNAAAAEDNLREAECRNNILHIVPSTNMLTDALAQFFVKKQWQKWTLIVGSKDNDKALADDLKKSAAKFGVTIVAEKTFDGDTDLRESASDEVPLMTQDGQYDAVIVADANEDFGSQIAYNSFYPRPVAGSHGLVPTSWSDAIEPWGAVQLQNAFMKQAGRGMRDIDFNAYLGVRIIGEAATRAKATDAASVRAFVLSPDFLMQAYKGRGLSFRSWNGQLRQPIHLVTKESQVAVAPFDGFLHEDNELDTLGPDKQETQCKNFIP